MTQPTHGDAILHADSESSPDSASIEQADPYVLQGSASSVVEKITLKHGDTFLVSDARGDLPESEQETGVYWMGTRFLRTCDIFLAGQPLIPLSHSISDEEGKCQIDITNPFLRVGHEVVYQGTIHVRRLLALNGNQLTETLLLTSFHSTPITVKVGLKLGADFRDIFEVRGMARKERGEIMSPHMSREGVTLSYHGLDKITRLTEISFSPPASQAVMQGLFWDVPLEHDVQTELQIRCDLRAEGSAPQDFEEAPQEIELLPRGNALPLVRSDNVFFNRMLSRGMHDLGMMCTRTPEGLFPYGGIPWYVCPFGRDGLVTSLEFLPWFPTVARGTLAFLAAHQGTKVDEFTEEEPGRILHEYRHGEMANCAEVPFIPYYGSVDATPLFLITLDQYIRWTNDMAFLEHLWPNATAAARWMRDVADGDGDSFLEYAKMSDKGLVNQGWKDSWDAISMEDGRLIEPPVALCEVQGYAFAAYGAIAALARRLGRHDEAVEWEQAAERIRANFLREFWWPEEQTFYLALDGEKRPARVMSSNAGQVLWTGIVPPEWAKGVVERLMAPDMYTEWGIRTLSSRAVRYNPMSYHNGSVWPHDTALVGAGFARYGHKQVAGQLLGNLFGVGLYYSGSRLPELFCGLTRVAGYGPTRYPVACAPQSWAAGAPFLLLGSVLGFEPEADRQRLTLHNPTLPDWMQSLDLGDVRLGEQRLAMRFERSERGTSVILTGSSEIEVHVLPE